MHYQTSSVLRHELQLVSFVQSDKCHASTMLGLWIWLCRGKSLVQKIKGRHTLCTLYVLGPTNVRFLKTMDMVKPLKKCASAYFN